MESTTFKEIWDTLSKIDCSDKVEKKNGLTYLSWAWAWGITMNHFPDAQYEIRQWNDKPYLVDDLLGIMVEVKVSIKGNSRSMSLPVMDGSNKAQKLQRYSYFVDEWLNKQKTGKKTEKFVESATMFDINTATMRCLVKTLAMFGLGHYIYAGEDLPTIPQEQKEPTEYLIPGSNTNTIKVEHFNAIQKLGHKDATLANEINKVLEKESTAVKNYFYLVCKSKALTYNKENSVYEVLEPTVSTITQ